MPLLNSNIVTQIKGIDLVLIHKWSVSRYAQMAEFYYAEFIQLDAQVWCQYIKLNWLPKKFSAYFSV